MEVAPRPWKTHGLILAVVLVGLLLFIVRGATDFALAFAFIFFPMALVYTLLSTALFLVAGKKGLSGVVLAHGLALAAGVGAALFFVRPG